MLVFIIWYECISSQATPFVSVMSVSLIRGSIKIDMSVCRLIFMLVIWHECISSQATPLAIGDVSVTHLRLSQDWNLCMSSEIRVYSLILVYFITGNAAGISDVSVTHLRLYQDWTQCMSSDISFDYLTLAYHHRQRRWYGCDVSVPHLRLYQDWY